MAIGAEIFKWRTRIAKRSVRPPPTRLTDEMVRARGGCRQTKATGGLYGISTSSSERSPGNLSKTMICLVFFTQF